MTIWIINKIIEGYILSILTFLIIILIKKQYREKSKDFLNTANIILLITLITNIIFAIVAYFDCKILENATINQSTVITNCNSTLLYNFFLGFVFQSLFILYRNRIKIVLTIISIVLLILFLNIESIIIKLSPYKDYLPSSWHFSEYNPEYGWMFRFYIVIFFICWIVAKIKSKAKA